MARTVVPPPPPSRRRDRGDGEPPPETGDSLPEKLVKYVPAETLAFFVPAAAAVGGDRDTLLLIVLVVAVIGSVGYLWVNAPKEPHKRPLKHFYVLAVVAFLCWALATSPSVSDLVGADETVSGLVLLGAVFLIPLADSVFTRLQGR